MQDLGPDTKMPRTLATTQPRSGASVGRGSVANRDVGLVLRRVGERQREPGVLDWAPGLEGHHEVDHVPGLVVTDRHLALELARNHIVGLGPAVILVEERDVLTHLYADGPVADDVALPDDRLRAEREAGLPGQPEPAPIPPIPPVPARSSPETRARILAMFKRGNRKYALPFENNRLALASFAGGNWEEYCQIILQMAILDTLLSIEEKLSQS